MLESYREFSLSAWTNLGFSSAVNNHFRNYRVRDSLQDKVRNEESCGFILSGPRAALRFWLFNQAQQPKKVPRIGYLTGTSLAANSARTAEHKKPVLIGALTDPRESAALGQLAIFARSCQREVTRRR